MDDFSPVWSAIQLGWNFSQKKFPEIDSGYSISRVSVEHRGAYEIMGETGQREAALDTRLRDSATNQLDYPAVGDWVVHTKDAQHDRRVLITEVLQRDSVIIRRAPKQEPIPQVVATNVDVLGIVTSADQPLDERRLERYLVTAFSSGVVPVVIVNKSDLNGTAERANYFRAQYPQLEVLETCGIHGSDALGIQEITGDGLTVALTGSSGVGKSTLVNRLLGEDIVRTGEVRPDGTGRHTTVRRQMFVLHAGGVVIDTPGLRELQLWDGSGLNLVFPEISEFVDLCRFSDCSHKEEPGCAVLEALKSGLVSESRMSAYQDLSYDLEELRTQIELYERGKRHRRDARS